MIVVRAFFVSSAVLLALLGLSVPTIEPGTGTFVISVVSAVMLSVVFVGSGACLYADWSPFEEILGS